MGHKVREKVPLNEELVDRIRQVLGPRQDVSDKRMFGGVCFLLDGKMVCGVVGDDLMVRVGPLAFEESLQEPHTRLMDFTGRPMRGFLYVEEKGWKTPRVLLRWVEAGLAYAAVAPTRKPRKPRPWPRA